MVNRCPATPEGGPGTPQDGSGTPQDGPGAPQNGTGPSQDGTDLPSGGDVGSGSAEGLRGRAAERARRRQRLDRIFGDVLPEATEDDRGSTATGDDWYRQNRPPHHDAR